MKERAGSVALRNIVKRHGTLTVLKGVDLDIRPGEFFALLGPSGRARRRRCAFSRASNRTTKAA